MKNIAIIPARSGSKGLKDKNIKELNGLPLLVYSIQAAKDSNLFDEIMVSTDSEVYAEIARSNGASVPFLRSAKLSTDTARSWDVVKEVLSRYKEMGRTFDSVCLLQPTSPLRVGKDIEKGYKLLKNKNANAVAAVCEVEHSPLWSMTLPEDLSLMEFRQAIKGKGPRQNLSTYYRMNGALYIRLIQYKDDLIEILDDKEYAYIMDRKRSYDIDVLEDFELVEYFMKKYDIEDFFK